MACMRDPKENPKQNNISISAVGRRFSEFVSSLKAEQSLNPLVTLCIAVLGAQLNEELQKQREENEKLGKKLKHAVIYVQRLEAEIDEARHVKKQDKEILESLQLERVRIYLMSLEIEDNEKLLARKEIEMDGLRRDLEKSRREASELFEGIQQMKHLCWELEAIFSDIPLGEEEEEEEGRADI